MQSTGRLRTALVNKKQHKVKPDSLRVFGIGRLFYCLGSPSSQWGTISAPQRLMSRPSRFATISFTSTSGGTQDVNSPACQSLRRRRNLSGIRPHAVCLCSRRAGHTSARWTGTAHAECSTYAQTTRTAARSTATRHAGADSGARRSRGRCRTTARGTRTR
jgi:hypothetical protein